ncbi:ATP-binding protein [Streptomyces sp. 7R007]
MPGSASHGDEWIDHAQAITAGPSAAANALRHAMPASTADVQAHVRLHLMRWTDRLVCAVRDQSDDTPVERDSEDFSAESGRGLFLVDSFADSWGWHPMAGALGGKVVWALFQLPEPLTQPTE